MVTAFYIASAMAIVSTALAVSRTNAVHALLYLVLSLISVAVLFLLLGAPFVAALEIIVYAGAIMVLFVFVVMLLNLGRAGEQQERRWMPPRAWIGPALIGAALLAELAYVLPGLPALAQEGATAVKPVAIAMYGPYLLGVEAAALLLLAGMVGAYHLGREPDREARR